jgi:hypothetical protein
MASEVAGAKALTKYGSDRAREDAKERLAAYVEKRATHFG